jgi:hypothetical protein
MVLTGYLDESEDDEWFSLGCIFSTGNNWILLEVDWKNCLERWNRKLTNENRKLISRYHGSDCWTRNKDFEGWSIKERNSFLDELREILGKNPGIHVVSFSLRTAELAEVFNFKTPKRTKAASYQLLVQYLMLQIGSDVDGKDGYEGLRVPFMHDRTKHYDDAIKRAFFELKDDVNFKHRKLFTTCVPMSWEDSIILQPADMVAYECRKQARRHGPEGGILGGEIKKIMELPSFGGSAFYFQKNNLQELKTVLEAIGHKFS